MKEDINIYNHFHNGDIFYARVLINGLLKKYNINFYHNLNVPLLVDMDGVTEISGIPSHFSIHTNELQNKNINSWIGQQNMIFVNTQIPGCSFENYLHLVKIILNYYNLELNLHEEDYLPVVNYEKILNYESITTIMNEIKYKYDKVILISNGNVNSGQAVNVDLSRVIVNLSDNNSNSLFLTTTPINHNKTNIIDTSSLTKTNPDLLQISLISTFCDIIVGRASGPHCYTHTKDNLLNQNKTYISFSKNVNEGVWYKNSKAKQIWSHSFNLDEIFDIINKEINK